MGCKSLCGARHAIMGRESQAMPGFNPLDTGSLTKIFVNELAACPSVALPKVDPSAVRGAGLYALYYSGELKLYRKVSSARCDWPIYLGSAMPTGGRTGNVRRQRKSPILDRLNRHRESIASTKLNSSYFHARWFEVDEPFIILGEILLLRFYRPLWNATLPGFGNKVVGGPRSSGKVSRWDTLHPGRAGGATAPGAQRTVIVQEIQAHLAQFPPGWSQTTAGAVAATSSP
jgi:hypothetical protein